VGQIQGDTICIDVGVGKKKEHGKGGRIGQRFQGGADVGVRMGKGLSASASASVSARLGFKLCAGVGVGIGSDVDCDSASGRSEREGREQVGGEELKGVIWHGECKGATVGT
jgi:hypothetical protein